MNAPKRLFFAFKVAAPWPEELPKGRLLRQEDRHMTMAFLGNADFEKLKECLEKPIEVPFKVGLTGIFDKINFLPPKKPRVVAWHAKFEEEEIKILNSFYHTLIDWLQKSDFSPAQPDREFLPHVTVSRSPSQFEEWRKAFHPIPLALEGFHLFESVGNLVYESRWKSKLHPPFEEIEHTADIGYIIRGETVKQIARNAKAALAFQEPLLLRYFEEKSIENLEDLVIHLNEAVTKADSKEGCSFKAVSFHGEISKEKDGTLSWEMIVDV